MSKKNKQKQQQQPAKPKIATKEIDPNLISDDSEFGEMHEALSLDWKVETFRDLGLMPQNRFDEMTDDDQFSEPEVAILMRRRREWRTENMAEVSAAEKSKADEDATKDEDRDYSLQAAEQKTADEPPAETKDNSKVEAAPATADKTEEPPADDSDDEPEETVILYDTEDALLAAKPTDPADRRKPFRVTYLGGAKYVWSWATGPAIVAVARWLGCSAKKIGPRKRPPAKTEAQKLAAKIAKMTPEEREQLKSLFATSEQPATATPAASEPAA